MNGPFESLRPVVVETGIYRMLAGQSAMKRLQPKLCTGGWPEQQRAACDEKRWDLLTVGKT